MKISGLYLIGILISTPPKTELATNRLCKIYKMKKLIFALLVLPVIVNAQMSKRDSTWLPMKYFVGEWHGNSEGEPGQGKYDRTYSWVLNKRFIEIKNTSTYPPSAQNNNKGEVHNDIGYISYDNGRKTFVLRHFHI